MCLAIPQLASSSLGWYLLTFVFQKTLWSLQILGFPPHTLGLCFSLLVAFSDVFYISYLSVLFSYLLNILKGNKPINITERKVTFHAPDRCTCFFLHPTSTGTLNHHCVTLLPRANPGCVSWKLWLVKEWSVEKCAKCSCERILSCCVSSGAATELPYGEWEMCHRGFWLTENLFTWWQWRVLGFDVPFRSDLSNKSTVRESVCIPSQYSKWTATSTEVSSLSALSGRLGLSNWTEES